MNRQVMFRLLLSLLLLFSQQMATAHALEHLGAALHGQAPFTPGAAAAAEASELAKAVAQHQNCHQCLALAHLGAPPPGALGGFAAPELTAQGAAQPTLARDRVRSAWARRARAPPPV